MEGTKERIKQLEDKVSFLEQQLEGAKGLVTVGGKQFLQAIGAYDTTKSELEKALKEIKRLKDKNKELEQQLEMACKQYVSLLNHHNEVLKAIKE